MKIVVCIKQVPDTAEVKLDPKTGTLIRDGVPSIINHDDKAGLETALQIREQVGGTVTVVCMGPPQADVALREALAMGADAVIICRPFVPMVYGGGEEGVKLYIDKIGAELEDTMAMCGAKTLADINRDMIQL